ncbi:cysteine desulfurase [Salix suchowensis]|nr:cysteine desulfurase [Salix suchowensis]
MGKELEQSMVRETTPSAQVMTSKNTRTSSTVWENSSPTVLTASSGSSSSSSISSPVEHLFRSSESLRALEIGVPESSSTEKKLAWLRSQIIGDDAEFDSPFGKRRLTYADHTASGRSLLYIENFIINNVLPFYGNTHTSDSYVGHRTTKMLREAAEYIKKCLGGGQDDAIVFCGSGTTAAIKRLQEVMGIAVASTLRERVIKCLSNEERWVVFVGPYEHHSNLLSWRQSLAEVVEIGLDDNGLIDIEDLRRRLESYKYANRPILGSFSASSNVTGIYSDTRRISQLLHEHGGFACFDFAASGPYVKINMRSGEVDGYDAIFLSPHKFLGGPGSPGILLMSRALYQLGSSAPSTCGGGTVNYVNGFSEKDTLYLTDIEERECGGTPQIIQTIRASLTFWIKEYVSHPVIKEQEDTYIEKALHRLLPNKNIWVLGNTTAKRQAILSFLIHSTTNSSSPAMAQDCDGIDSKDVNDGVLYMWRETGNSRDKPLHGPFIAALLNDLFGIQARGGCACAGPYGHRLLHVDEPSSLAFRSAIEKGYCGVKPGWTRVSFPYYMSNEKFEFILTAIEFTAIYGQRFLPLYHFNWKTGSWTFKQRELNDLVDKDNNGGCINNFESYLIRAKQIADLLPKFPSQRKIPPDIDPDLLFFRV